MRLANLSDAVEAIRSMVVRGAPTPCCLCFAYSESRTPSLQLKLDELIRATEARNRLIGIERLPEPDLESVREKIEKKKPFTSHMTAIPLGIQSKTLMRMRISPVAR